MNRTTLVTIALLCVALDGATAQIIRPTSVRRPMGWASLGAGWTQQQTICDPANDACWNFASAPQYRGSLELPLGSGAGSWGLAVTSSRVPLVWATQNPSANSCTQCDANVNVTQYLGVLHLAAGGGGGFQQVVELGAGATQFTNFRDVTGVRLGNGKPITDFSFAVSLGIGYTVSSQLQLTLAQEYAMLIHKRQSGTTNNSAQQQTLRLGLRLALGER